MEFVPDGFLPLERAVLAVAKRNEPSLWDDLALTPIEARLYGELGIKVHSRELAERLRSCLSTTPHDPGVRARFHSYWDTRVEVRKKLFSGALPSIALLKQSGRRVEIPAECWASENADNWFADSELFAGDGTTTRVPFGAYVPGLPDDVNFYDRDGGEFALILIPEAELFAHLLGGGASVASSETPEPETKAPGLVGPAQREEFERWRRTQKELGRTPTLAEDIGHMKQFGVNRDRVRALRKSHDRLPRGRPKVTSHEEK